MAADLCEAAGATKHKWLFQRAAETCDDRNQYAGDMFSSDYRASGPFWKAWRMDPLKSLVE